MASAQKTIRVSTDKTDLVMQVSPKGRLYQVYLGDQLKNPSDYNHLKWDVYAASDGSVCQRGHEVEDVYKRQLQTSVRNFTLVFLFQLVTCEPMVLAGKNFDRLHWM